ncbi:hypothetical protein PFICI_08236 [Pestalotiopsis fici W106-1]|uniref:F-box domain-containing protein n=1 Tax=Pestalotiopsis fici (strain W106-1 / CGMCC3.15140) TaxID=1229662 RepID=W3X5N7_PESFW|nr:uncharacterized protein PFICI_08236 [Pestalotiopsis fici W106-1]ETS80707.1 hypothetical protein PFICI_08236 [Pestalotiopsis fici W106-1]
MAQSEQTPQKVTAVASVWAISEIAESILARLPMKDLLLAQRVSTSWKYLIKSSPVLQELLFMRPRQSETVPKSSSNGKIVREYNPLLLEHMPTWFSRPKGISFHTVENAPWAQTGSRPAFLCRDASWRHMLLAQPPFTMFESAQHVYTNDSSDSLLVGCIECPAGVRMGLAYDQAVQPVQDGLAIFPNHFYTLMDGVIAHDAQGLTLLDGGEWPERLFGGTDKFTIFSWVTFSNVTPSEEASEMKRNHFTSAGFDPVEIVLHRIKSPDEIVLYGVPWWCQEGYLI